MDIFCLMDHEHQIKTNYGNSCVPLHFHKTNGEVDQAIDQLMALVGNVNRPLIARQMILTALKAGMEDDGGNDLKQMSAALKELRYTAKAFSPYRHIRKVSVFGSARLQPETDLYAMARRFGEQMVAAGYMVITGGGPGVMQAVNEGAGPENSFGVNIKLPFEQKPNPILDGNPRHITYKYFFTRKVAFLKEADAVVLFPGGFGTLDEAMETLTLVQTGKRNPMPVIFLDVPGGNYWARWERFIREEIQAPGFADPIDNRLFDMIDNVDQAVERIVHFYRCYHSIRYVRDHLIIRLRHQLNTDQVHSLNADYRQCLLPGGSITSSQALPEERDEPDLLNLPRLCLDFNKKDFAQLKALIEAINNFFE
jgi:uncharacterized protein (TIGR00730 family)